MNFKLTHYLLLIALICWASVSKAQVGINTDNSTPDSSAMLDVKSSDKGILVPRMSSTERTAIEAPAESSLVYDNDTQSFWYIKAGTWVEIGETITEAQVDAFVANNGYLTNADNTDADPTNELELPSTDGTAGQFLQTDGAGTVSWGTDGTHGAADQIHFVTNGAAQMTVASDGRIGIDQKSPQADLHIRQSQQSIDNGLGGIRYEDGNDDTDYWRTYHSGVYFSFNLSGSRVAYVNTNGSWTVDSDLTLKKNISDFEPTLNKVMQMRPVTYHYKEQKNSDSKSLGFIAQEVKPLFPEMVVTGEDGKLGMSYSYAGVIAIKAIQEQQEIIEQQKQQIESQEQRLQSIEEELEALKKMIKK